MKHLDLFSGIGGFAVAVEMVWGKDVEHTFVEYDPFCQEILKKHWPKAKIHGDIREFVTDTKRERSHAAQNEQKLESKGSGEFRAFQSRSDERSFLLTGGFPCQPFSHAGRRKGTADDRYLWPPMLEAISIFKPRWVIAENVAGLVTWDNGVVLETVCSDLENEGYEVQPFIIPASAIGAPHRRDRVWIVAHRTSGWKRSGEREGSGTGESKATIGNGDSDAPNTRPQRRSKRGNKDTRPESKVTKWQDGSIGSWEWDWKEIAIATCDGGVDDGVPKRMDRNPRLKALGNAIVPQVAAEIMRAIPLQSN